MGAVGEDSSNQEETWVMGLGTTTKYKRSHVVRETLSYPSSFERTGCDVSHSRVVPLFLDGNKVQSAAAGEEHSKEPGG